MDIIGRKSNFTLVLGFWLWFGLWLWSGLWFGSEKSVRVLIFPPEPSKLECVTVSHVIFECRVSNHHPTFKPYNIIFFNKNKQINICKTGALSFILFSPLFAARKYRFCG